MKSVTALAAVAIVFFSGISHAQEQQQAPLNYNSSGMESDAQNSIVSRDAEIVENEYKDLDQDGVADKLDHCLNTIFGVKVDSKGCELDSDQDGVFDRLDQCPDTAPGVKVNVFGCEGDDDSDGVVNSKDRCPETPLGTPVDKVGCKLIGDSDKDGVNDNNDQCPETPAGAVVNDHGCEPVSFVLTNIVFDFDKHNIRDDQQPILKKDAAALQALKEDEIILITGHTDWKGKQTYNLPLSWRRANSCKDFIVEELGNKADSIYINGKGELEPVATNRTDEGRQMNRRIEFKIMKKDQVPADARLDLPTEMVKQ